MYMSYMYCVRHTAFRQFKARRKFYENLLYLTCHLVGLKLSYSCCLLKQRKSKDNTCVFDIAIVWIRMGACNSMDKDYVPLSNIGCLVDLCIVACFLLHVTLESLAPGKTTFLSNSCALKTLHPGAWCIKS